jgi:DNA-binding LytR/AlgR family response regulator
MTSSTPPALRVLVVEDERPARDYLVELLQACDPIAEVVAASGVGEATLALHDPRGIAAAFVDIRLVDRPADTTGLAWARAVLARPASPLLVFATAIPDHALAAFEAGAVDYLLKPFTPARVERCVDRLHARRQLRTDAPGGLPPRLVARAGSSLVFLALDGVYAFEAADRLTHVHHADGTFLVDPSLAALELDLAPRVLRVHRNWLVATAQVRRMERGTEPVLVVGPGLKVPVSRDRAAVVREALLASALGM